MQSEAEGNVVLGRNEQLPQGAEVHGQPGIGGDPVLRLVRAEGEIGTGGEERPRQGHQSDGRQGEEETGGSATR